MFEIIKAVISRGGYDLNTILRRIDVYHIEGKVTDAEREQLYALARSGGVTAGFDVEAEIGRLWEAVRKLQESCVGASRAGANGARAKLEFALKSAKQGTTVIIGHARHRLSDLVSGRVACTRIGVE